MDGSDAELGPGPWDGTDLVGTAAGVPDAPPLQRLVPVLAGLARDAGAVDRDGVQRAHLETLARAGLFALTVDTGGAGHAPAAAREAVERLSAASGAVWFVATQHASPARAARATANLLLQERWAGPLADGDAFGAVGFAHVRRGGPPAVRAKRVPGGWRIDGRLDWLTSWGIADVVLLFAQSDDGRIVQVLLPAQPRVGWEVTGPLELAAMSATSTVGVRLDGLCVTDDEVCDVVARSDWLAADRLRTANTNPAVIGLLRAVVDDLRRLGVQRDQRPAVVAAQRLADETVRLRAAAYHLLDDVPDDERLDERLGLRAQLLDLAQRAAGARIAAEGGAAMTLGSPAQRWAREAMFHLVQAQTQPLRAALLEGFSIRTLEEERP